MPVEKQYFAKDAEFQDELERTRLREQEWDPITIRCLTDISVSRGWHCLEVGAGGGSIARWLGERISSTGRVVVVDIDTRFVDNIDLPNVAVRRQDITKDELEADAYDLVHCRALLMHMSDPEAVLRRFVRALRPGGWMLAEECDLGTLGAVDRAHPLAQAHDAITERIGKFWQTEGIIDGFLGRALPALFNRLGLVDVTNEGVARVIRGGDPWAQYMEKTFQRTDQMLMMRGILTQSEIVERGRALEDPTFYFRDLLFDACWGRRVA